MKSYIEQLQACISADPPRYRICNGGTILEALFYCYAASNLIDNKKISAGFDLLSQCTNGLALKDEDIVFDTVCGLCREHERRAFTEGVRAGVALMAELYGK